MVRRRIAITLTVGKLALVALAYLHDLARILSFLVAGALLMTGSWAYQRLERRFGAAAAHAHAHAQPHS